MDAADRARLEALCLEVVLQSYANHRLRLEWDARAPEPTITVATLADDIISNRGGFSGYTRARVTAEVRLATARLVRAGALARSRASGARGGEAWAFEPPPVANPAKPKGLLLWHATDKAFDRFDPDRSGLGTHFGTYRAAMARRHTKSHTAWKATKYRVTVTNPLRVHDFGTWDEESDVEGHLIRLGLMMPQELPVTRALSGAAFWSWVRRRIEDGGYDAIVYNNRVEDRGNDSFVIWRDDQIAYAPKVVANPTRRELAVANPAVRFDVKLEQRGYVEIAIRMLRGSKKIGQFAGTECRGTERDKLMAGRCGPAVLAAEREAGRPLRVFLAYNTAVLDAEKGTGLGAELYAQAIIAAAKLGGVLARANCTGWIGTTAEARRVWASKRLRERFAFFGDAVAYGGTEIPPGHRQVETGAGRGSAVANPAKRGTSSLLDRIDALRPAIARAAQGVCHSPVRVPRPSGRGRSTSAGKSCLPV